MTHTGLDSTVSATLDHATHNATQQLDAQAQPPTTVYTATPTPHSTTMESANATPDMDLATVASLLATAMLSVFAAMAQRLTTVRCVLSTLNVTSMATVDVMPTIQDLPVNATSDHAIAAAVHAQARKTLTAVSVSTTHTWTTSVPVSAMSTGLERTALSRLITLDSVLEAAMVAVPAHLPRTA